MKNWRTITAVVITVLVFWFIKFYLKFPDANLEAIGIILTIASILFGFLAGFFISELWTRYTEIRDLQGIYSSEGLNMVTYAQHFFTNKKFEQEFKKSVEKCCVSNEIVEWHEGELHVPYARAIGDSFEHIEVKNDKDSVYFDNMLDSYNNLVETSVRLDMLGKERLFPSEWFIVIALSLIIAISILFLSVAHFFYQVIVLVFPAIIVLAISIIYDLDTLLWSKEIISIEPNARLFDAIGVKRFYLKNKKQFVHNWQPDYRTEDNLEYDLKKIYYEIMEKRKR